MIFKVNIHLQLNKNYQKVHSVNELNPLYFYFSFLQVLYLCHNTTKYANGNREYYKKICRNRLNQLQNEEKNIETNFSHKITIITHIQQFNNFFKPILILRLVRLTKILFSTEHFNLHGGIRLMIILQSLNYYWLMKNIF